MSKFCPLCEKNKPEETLFCESCSKKIKTEYEVEVPETPEKTLPEPQENAIENDAAAPIVIPPKKTHSEEVVVDEIPPEKPKRKRKSSVFLWILLIVVLLVGAFLFYNQNVRQENLERAHWEAAIKDNTIAGYLAYIEENPYGAHVDEAQENMMKLRSAEVAAWETMKASENTAELRDYLQQNPNSPYNTFIKNRLDSLTWMGALNTNTAESYSDYMMLAQSGEFNGDYFAEAQKRNTMLFQSYPVDASALDSIRATVNGFYASLSAVDHAGMSQYLAPTVNRFFHSGTAPREKITGELLVAGAKTQGSTIKFTPNLTAVQYEKTFNDHYKVNVPLSKSYTKSGANVEVYGYIVHFELNPVYQIVSVHETKPFVDAP